VRAFRKEDLVALTCACAASKMIGVKSGILFFLNTHQLSQSIALFS